MPRCIGDANCATGSGGAAPPEAGPTQDPTAEAILRLADRSDKDSDQSSTGNEEFSTDRHSYDYLSRNLDNQTTIKTVNVIASEECFEGSDSEASNNTFCGKADKCLVRYA